MAGCRPFKPDEIKKLKAAFVGRTRKRNILMFMLGITSGFRVSEILSLKVGDVFQCGRLVDVVSVERKSMKGKHCGREVPLHSLVKPYLLDWLYELKRRGIVCRDEPLFTSERTGKAITRKSAWRILHTTARKVGIVGKIGTHSWRKTFAARMHPVLGRDLRKLQTAMGHRKVDSTAQYLPPANMDEILTAMQEAFRDE